MHITNRLLLSCATLGLVFQLCAGCANVQPAAGGGDASQTGSGGKKGTNSGSGGLVITLPDAGTFETPPGISLKCGNGSLDPGEDCDDGNTNDMPSDGCTRLCQIEAGWTCPNVGEACSPPKCGDGVLADSETCDDGNTNDGDGCSADCKTIDSHFQCRVPGKRCVPICGDGYVVKGIETCDDNNTNDGDGCSSTCLIEPGSGCDDSMPSVCTKSMCGNGKVETGESCDLGDKNGIFVGDGKGCSRTCTTEPSCRDSSGKNQACKSVCGDGNVDMSQGSSEECDDGNQSDGDGCTHDCKKEAGWSCDVVNKPDATDCKQQGNSGMCLELPVVYRDFKNEHETGGHPDFMYHSTSRPCIPNSSGPAHCGDAQPRCWDIVMADTLNGKPQLNGSPTCKCQFTDWSVKNDGNHVPGYTMTNSPITAPTSNNSGAPVYVNAAVPIVKSATTFNQWFNDSTASSPASAHTVGTLELVSTGTSFRFSSNPDSVQGGFFPLDPTPAPTAAGTTAAGENLLCNLWPYWYSSASFGAGNGCKGDQYLFPPSIPAPYLADARCTGTDNPGCVKGTWVTSATLTGTGGVQGKWHDAWFTDEVHYYFVYTAAGLDLQFYGDDDMYIFVNGKLVVDLGGIHQRLPGRVTVTGSPGNANITEGGFLDTAGNILPCASNDPADPKLLVCGVKAVTGDDCRSRTVNLGLTVGSTYEIAIFGADRGATESNYQLTLNGFSTNETVCTPRCGDGAISGGEECDCGTDMNNLPAGCTSINDDNVYGGCTTQCKYGAYCGDNNVDSSGNEACDAGKDNGATYITDLSNPGCSVTCQLPHYCGDMHPDTAFGEQCDLGKSNGMKVQVGDKMCVVCDDKCQLVTEC
ncbi:MAG TPA: DUF4215 domain-containing protein [Polyangia bacterium]|jgi:fibro-slime domain-containing protein